MADIVVVGAGPVGLWTAIQIKKRDPDLDIVMYERYQEYQRSHILRLENLSMLLYAKTRNTPHEKEFFKEITGKGLTSLIFNIASSNFVPTNTLESALTKMAGAVGIKITYEKIESPDSLMAKHPECRAFIAADGAHSRMRSALMNEKPVARENLQYVAELKYKAAGPTKPLALLSDGYKANKLLSNMVFEYVGRERNGLTPVTLRFFLDEETYAALPDAEFKKPLTLNDSRIPEAFTRDVQIYLNIREAMAGENYMDGSAKLTKLPLSLYAADKFALSHEDKSWFFVGDAAMGVPFFRSLNAGFLIGSQLANILTSDTMSDNVKITAYNLCRPLDVGYEFALARGKNMALRLYDIFRRLSAKAPWETMKWDPDTVDQVMTRRHRAFQPGKDQKP